MPVCALLYAVGLKQHQKAADSGVEFTVNGQVRIFCLFKWLSCVK